MPVVTRNPLAVGRRAPGAVAAPTLPKAGSNTGIRFLFSRNSDGVRAGSPSDVEERMIPFFANSDRANAWRYKAMSKNR
jgi:hypothetical protein